MEIFLLYLNAFLRPILSVDLTGGRTTITEFSEVMELNNWAAIGLFVLLAVAFLSNTALRKNIRLSAVDLMIWMFGLWCMSIFVIYIDEANARETVKLLFPLFTYIVAKNVLRDRMQYQRMIAFMIIGFLLPVFWSAGMIMMGMSIEEVNYWTQVPRFKGIYPAAHNMGHNMTFLLMVISVHVALKKPAEEASQHGRQLTKVHLPTLLLAITALYCLGMAQARTQIVATIAFLGYYLYVFQRKMFFVAASIGTVAAIAFAPLYFNNLFYELDKVTTGEWEADKLASARPMIWRDNLERYANISFDRQLAGVGIGNKTHLGGSSGLMDSHNDYLDLMIQTGVVGLLLYIGLQITIFRKILALPGKEKHVFGAIFVVVVLMSIISNGYITRSAMAQMFFLTMAYIELPRKQNYAVHKA